MQSSYDEVVRVSPNPISPVTLYTGKLEHGDKHAQRGTPCEDGGRDASVSQRALKTSSKPLEAKRGARSLFLLTALRRDQPCRHLDLELLASRTVLKCLLCKPSDLGVLSYSSRGKRTDLPYTRIYRQWPVLKWLLSLPKIKRKIIFARFMFFINPKIQKLESLCTNVTKKIY